MGYHRRRRTKKELVLGLALSFKGGIMKLIVQETYLVNIPQTDNYEDAVDIFHTDATDLYEVKHYGYDFKKEEE